MSYQRNKLGFTVVETVLVLVIVALIGLVGYKIYNTQKSIDRVTNDTEVVLESPISTNAKEQSTINSASDLKEVESSLEELGASTEDDKDLSQLESELSGF